MSDTTTADPNERILDAGAETPEAPLPAVPDEEQALAIPDLPGVPDIPATPEQNELTRMAQLARTFAGAELVPKALRGKPADVLLVMMTARSLGLDYPTGFRELYIVEGKVSMSQKSKLALVRRSGIATIWPDADNDAESATWHGIRRDQPSITYHSTFTMADAARVEAREKDKAITLDRKSTWRSYPKRMLSWRALGYLIDDLCPEVATGLYSPDELGAVTDDEGHVIDIGEVEPLVQSPAEERKAERAAVAAELAPEEDRRSIYERIRHLPAEIKEGDEGLNARWAAGGLPLPRELPVNMLRRASSMVKGFESKARSAVEGWEPWTPDAQEAQDAPEPAPGPDAPSEPSAAQDTPEEPAETGDQPEPVDDGWPEIPTELAEQAQVVLGQIEDLVSDCPKAEVDSMAAQIKKLHWQAVNSALLDDYGVPQRVIDQLHIDTRRMLLTGYRLGERPMT